MTERDEKVLEFVRTFLGQRGYPPSVRQIATGLDLASTSGVHQSLVRLRRLGKVTWEEGQPRTMTLVDA